MIQFRVDIKPEPQGSMKSYVRGGRAVLVSDNPKLKAFRADVRRSALESLREDKQSPPPTLKFVERIPVALRIECGFIKPKSAKKRTHMVVKPDADKLARAIFDALTGVIFHDDAQVVSFSISKVYADQEYVDVTALEVCE